MRDSFVGVVRVALIFVVAACEPEQPQPESWTIEALAGRYDGLGHIWDLHLASDGTYGCAVFNGITISGCGTIEGAGESEGAWTFDGSVIRFLPSKESHVGDYIAVSFEGATAVPSEEGLVFTSAGIDRPLTRVYR